MIKNYFKIAFRNLAKNKTYGIINITGLAIGLASFIIILLYLNYELSYDKWSPSLKKVYKVSLQTDDDILQTTPAPLGSLLRQHSSNIEAATTIQAGGDFESLLAAGEKKIYQNGYVEADSSFFKVFPYKIVSGSAGNVLDKPNAIVLSKEVSEKLFGEADPVGKTVKLFNAYDLEVTGIMEQPDKPSHLNVRFVYRSPNEKDNFFWENYSFETYVKTNQALEADKLEQEVDRIYYENRIKKDKRSLAEFRKAGHREGLFMDAVPNIHNFPKHGKSNFKTASILLFLAGLLLLAGAINFSNLSIASSVRRAKEVGVRKTLGSSRGQLGWQFISEVTVQCLISLCFAILLVNLALPYFNKIFSIQLHFFQSGKVLSLSLQIILCLLIVIVLSGLYPAVFLSRYNITKVLKGDYSTGTKGAAFRNVLIVVQFTVAAFFIIGALVIGQQMHYMKTKDKGFSGEQVIRIQAQQNTREKNFDVMRSTLLTIPGVEYVSRTTTVPGDAIIDTNTTAFKYSGKEYRMTSVKVSTDYFRTLDASLVQGRMFDSRYADQNTRTAVINEAAAKKLNLKNPIGTVITFPGCDTVPVRIEGVVKNFNVSGFENAVQPVVFTIGNKACIFQSGGAILVKIKGAQIQQTVANIEGAWRKIEPEFPIRYSFLDDNFQKLFATYTRLQQVINFFGFTAILISVMGLFALTAFLISQRTKEIGIRKILGAGINELSLLLSKDFVRLVLIAVLIATPCGWWAASEWLQGFAYHTTVNWLTFLSAALIIIAIALLTISFQTIKAAIANPVKSLRTE